MTFDQKGLAMPTRGHRSVRRILLPLLVAFVVSLLAGGTGAAGASTRAASATKPAALTWGVPQTVRGLDYTHSGDPGSASVIFLGMEPLLEYNKAGGLKPDLATSLSVPNPTTYIFNLRRGVKFWDGTPFTSADAIYSLQESAAKGSELATFFANVKSMKANGSRLTIRLKQPDPFFRYTISVTPIGEKRFWSTHLKNLGTPGVLNMGTGPFRFTSFTPGEGVTLVRNDHYWGRKPSISKLTLKFIVDPNTMLLAVRSHQVDGTFKLPYQQINQYKSLPGVSVQIAPEELAAYLSLDCGSAPYDDIHVRRALAYATDKAGMVSAILRGYGAPAPTMPPPQQWGDLIPQAKVAALYASLPHYSYNPANAKAELAKSNVPNGFTAAVTFPDAHPELGKALEVLAQDVKSLGITLNVTQVPLSQWLNTLYTHPTPMGMQVGNWTPDFPDPADALALIYPSANAHSNSFNTANYKNPAMDALIARQAKSVKSAVRAQTISQALKLAAVDVPYIPLWYQQFGMALNSNYRYTQFGPWYTYQAWALDISPK
jgi:peptide/nickel transport system substrate-binding protein